MTIAGRILIACSAAVLLGLGSSAAAPAQGVAIPVQTVSGWLAYRNDTAVPVFLQGSVILPNGTERRGTPHQINPREAAWDQVIGAGPKILTIYDAKGRLLSRDTVPFVGKDLFFSIQLEVLVKGNEKIIKTRLVPVPDPRLNGQAPGFQGLPGAAGNAMPVYPSLPGGLNPIMTPGGPVVLPGAGVPPRPLPR